MFSFRIRFRLGERTHIDQATNELALADRDGLRIVIRARDRDQKLRDAREVVIQGDGYASQSDAERGGERWRDRVQRAFARLNIGAQFGEQIGGGAFTTHGLAWLESEHGRTVLNDFPGVTVYESALEPLFASSSAKATVGQPRRSAPARRRGRRAKRSTNVESRIREPPLALQRVNRPGGEATSTNSRASHVSGHDAGALLHGGLHPPKPPCPRRRTPADVRGGRQHRGRA